LGAVSAALQPAFSAEIERYTSTHRHAKRLPSAKIINDPVWRTVRLESWEVFILDSPLLQRLRRIHQLGLAGYVFPGASYSRFEHSIGVVHQTQRLIDAINRNARAHAPSTRLPPADPIVRTNEVFLRLAALLHDVGHCFLSHVSERALQRLDPIAPGAPIKQVLAEARSFFRIPNRPALAELFSALIVLLPEFEGLLRLARVPGWEDPAALADRISRVIVGARDPKAPYLTEIISGAMDADKLDYMPRDCYMAGLPMPVDVDRMLEKVHVVRVPVKRLPLPELYPDLRDTDVVEVLAIHPGGARAFEESVLSRFLLYSKLYYHQKVRCMEGMVVNALELLMSSETAFKRLDTYLTLTDEDFLLGKWPTGVNYQNPDTETALRLVGDLARRRSFERCCAFGPPLSTTREKEFRRGWETLGPLVSRVKSEHGDQFREDLLGRAKKYLRATGQAGLADSIAAHDILIDLPETQGITEKLRFFVGDDQTGVEMYAARYKVGTWAEAYEDQKTLGYVYTWPQFSTAVHFAFADVVKEKTGLVFDEGSWRLTKLPPSDLREFAANLARALPDGYPTFQLPTHVADHEDYLQSDERKSGIISRHSPLIAELADRFKTFQAADFTNISQSRIEEWLQQFEPDEIPLAVTVLQHVRFWNRAALVDALAEGIKRTLPGQARIQALPIGGVSASGHHLAYYFDDLRSALPNCDVIVLESAKSVHRGVPLLLYEDNIGLGRQPSTVIQQWFGTPRGQWLVDEKHVEPLEEAELDALRSCPVGVLFVTGSRQGLNQLERVICQMLKPPGLRTWIVSPSELSCFQPAAGVFRTQKDARDAEAAFRRTGLLALGDAKQTWTPERLDNSLLGYGNAGQLTVLDYNTPATTLTALWRRCTDPQSLWTPLFPRRKREH
jgi:HD superfamily phosphohydrolase